MANEKYKFFIDIKGVLEFSQTKLTQIVREL